MPRQASTSVRGNAGPPRVKSTEFSGGGPPEGRGRKRAASGAERQEQGTGWRKVGGEKEKGKGRNEGNRGREIGARRLYQSLNALRALHPENFRRNINCDESRLGILLQQEFSPKQSAGSKDSSPASEASGRARSQKLPYSVLRDTRSIHDASENHSHYAFVIRLLRESAYSVRVEFKRGY